MEAASLLPVDANDTAAVRQLATRPFAEQTELLPRLFRWLGANELPSTPSVQAAAALIVSYLVSLPTPISPNDPVIQAISSTLEAPAPSGDDTRFKYLILSDIVSPLPHERMRVFKAGISSIAALAPPPPVTDPHAMKLAIIASDAEDALRYLAAMDAARPYTPRHKHDFLALRSLREATLSDREMAPFIPALLEWLQDLNWPVARACMGLLALYPMPARDGIQTILLRNDDEMWVLNILEFLREVDGADDVGGGWASVREACRAAVERIAVEPTEDGRWEAARIC